MKFGIILILVVASYSSAFPNEKKGGDKRGLFPSRPNVVGVNNHGHGSFGNRPTFGSGLGGIHQQQHGGYNNGRPSSGCRYWCRTPQGQAYCCENNNQRPTGVGLKPGQCPPVRPACPPTRSFGPPQTCSNDYSCGGNDKCCFDTCLQEHVCKAPIGYGR